MRTMTLLQRRRIGLALRLALFGGLLALAMRGGDWADGLLSSIGAEPVEPLHDGRVWVAAVAYALLMAMPFCPGIELGLALLVLFGAAIAPLVYAATLLGLLAAFMAGRFVPQRALAAVFAATGMRRTCELLQRIADMGPPQRVELLQRGAVHWRQPLLRHRHAALAVALNLPGNIVLGGGGGIALLAGLSRLFTLPAFALTVALAVAPVPLAVVLFGVRAWS